MILCCIFVIVTLIEHHHAAIPILYVGVWVGIDCCEHVLYKESAPATILDRIAECHRISRRGLTRLCNIQAEDARVLIVIDDLTTLEELYWRRGEIYELAHLSLGSLDRFAIFICIIKEVEELA